MYVFNNVRTFVDFLNKKVNMYKIDFASNHIGFVVLTNKKIIGKFELADKIYLDLNI